MLIVLCGPTATGKSSLGIKLARRLASVIISADSRCCYRDFDIGTAKPSLEERSLIPHYLINTHEPVDTITLADYQSRVQELIVKFHGVGTVPLLVGGTGLYIKSIVKGMKIPRVSPQVELRQQLGKLGQGQLYQILLKIDEIAAQKIHPNDHVRTLRAVEVYYVTGKPISSQQGENPPPYPILQIGVDWEDLTVSDGQIAKRTHGMIDLGLVDEVKYLINKYGIELPLLNTLGYAEIKQYLLGEIQLEEAIDLIILHTRQFAKQQRTWFKAIPEIEWYNSGDRDLLDMVYQRINQFMKECS